MPHITIQMYPGRDDKIKQELADAVDEGWIAGAALDVFVTEPLPADNPLLHVRHPERLSLAPHVAWASDEARKRLVDMIAENISTLNRF
mgnify:CR=1 FL=1